MPDGYDPLPEAEIAFLDATGTQIGSGGKTDNCGRFDVNSPQNTIRVKVTATGFRDIDTDLTVFQPTSPTEGVANTIPDTSTYQIGSLSKLDDFSVCYYSGR